MECLCLNPCWWGIVGMFAVMMGRRAFSSVLAMGERSEMGL